MTDQEKDDYIKKLHEPIEHVIIVGEGSLREWNETLEAKLSEWKLSRQKDHALYDLNIFSPPLTRRERRAKERKNKKK